MRASRSLAQSLSQWASTSATASSSRAALGTARRVPVACHGAISAAPSKSCAPSFNTQRAYLSTSPRWNSSATDAKSEANKAAGEAMGATEGKKPAEVEAGEQAAQEAAAAAGGAGMETGAEGSSGKELDALKATIKEKDAKIKELTDAVLYGKADLQNAQRRAKDEKAQAGDYAITKLARDLTSSLDILALALRSVPEELRQAPKDAAGANDARKAVAELYSGVELTSKSIIDMLKMHGVTVFDPTGEKFDPLEHEAMYQAPVPGKEPGTVLECSKVGFRIKDRILRAAQVGVVQEAQ